MTSQREDFKMSIRIYDYLQRHHELNKDRDMCKEMYQAYINSVEVQKNLDDITKECDCVIEHFGDTLYLVPNLTNTFLGYSEGELKRKICRTNATQEEFYLSMFYILVLMLEFYDGHGYESRIRNYIRLSELQNNIGKYLEEGASAYSEEEQNDCGISFTKMRDAYQALKSSDGKERNAKTTKEGSIYSVLYLLKANGLITIADNGEDKTIYTTEKFDSYMNYKLLNRDNYTEMIKVLEELKK